MAMAIAPLTAPLIIAQSPAQAAQLTNWRFDPATQQLEINVNGGTTPRYFLLAQPARIVLDLPNTRVGSVPEQQTYAGAVRQIRVGQFQPGLTRIVIELSPEAVLGAEQVELQNVGNPGSDRWVLRPVLANQPEAVPPPVASRPTPGEASSTEAQNSSNLPQLEPDTNFSPDEDGSFAASDTQAAESSDSPQIESNANAPIDSVETPAPVPLSLPNLSPEAASPEIDVESEPESSEAEGDRPETTSNLSESADMPSEASSAPTPPEILERIPPELEPPADREPEADETALRPDASPNSSRELDNENEPQPNHEADATNSESAPIDATLPPLEAGATEIPVDQTPIIRGPSVNEPETEDEAIAPTLDAESSPSAPDSLSSEISSSVEDADDAATDAPEASSEEELPLPDPDVPVQPATPSSLPVLPAPVPLDVDADQPNQPAEISPPQPSLAEETSDTPASEAVPDEITPIAESDDVETPEEPVQSSAPTEADDSTLSEPDVQSAPPAPSSSIPADGPIPFADESDESDGLAPPEPETLADSELSERLPAQDLIAPSELSSDVQSVPQPEINQTEPDENANATSAIERPDASEPVTTEPQDIAASPQPIAPVPPRQAEPDPEAIAPSLAPQPLTLPPSESDEDEAVSVVVPPIDQTSPPNPEISEEATPIPASEPGDRPDPPPSPVDDLENIPDDRSDVTSDAIIVAASPDVLIPSGTVLQLRFPNTTPQFISTEPPRQDVFVMNRAVRDQNGTVIAPVGSEVLGRFEKTANGIRFVTQAIRLSNRNLPLTAESGRISPLQNAPLAITLRPNQIIEVRVVEPLTR
jgi:hypothetical protein